MPEGQDGSAQGEHELPEAVETSADGAPAPAQPPALAPPADPTPSPEDREATRALRAWQRRLLPFMMSTLVVVALTVLAGSVWYYRALTHDLSASNASSDILANASKGATSLVDKDFNARTLLEVEALRSRRVLDQSLVASRSWARLVAFLVGVELITAGCVFILGQLRVEFTGDLKAPKAGGAMTTNSPGIVLAVLGAALIVVAELSPLKLEDKDHLVYLPRESYAVSPPDTQATDTSNSAAPLASSSMPPASASTSAPGSEKRRSSTVGQRSQPGKAELAPAEPLHQATPPSASVTAPRSGAHREDHLSLHLPPALRMLGTDDTEDLPGDRDESASTKAEATNHPPSVDWLRFRGLPDGPHKL